MSILSLPRLPFLGFVRKTKAVRSRLLPAYRHESALRRNRKKLATALFLFTIIYIMAFQLFGRFFVAPFLFPLGLLMLLIIWALPENKAPPLRALEFCFTAFLFALLIWPDYLALSLPGFPWITAVRLTGFPMIALLLVALSVSMTFRKQLKAVLAPSRPLVRLVVAFAAVLLFSLVVSNGIAVTANKLVVAGVNLIGAFFISAYVFARPGQATRFVFILWGVTIFLCLIGLWEARIGRLPWAGHIPSFLAVEDEAVKGILSPSARAATGIFRVRSRFNTPLSFAEFLGLATPFILHIALTAQRFWLRPLAMATLPLIFWLIVKTDSRLGVAGFLMSFVLYTLAWGAFTWYRDKRSIFGPAITIAYPAIFAAFIAATFFVGRLRSMVWGGGQHQASNLSRELQWESGIPKILARPWGNGLGQGGEALGFVSQSGMLTVDSYYLTILLDLGIIGFLLFIAVFVLGILRAAWFAPRARSYEERMLVPIAISFANFLIAKSVLTQQENHPLMFIFLGMSVALIWRMQSDGAERGANALARSSSA